MKDSDVPPVALTARADVFVNSAIQSTVNVDVYEQGVPDGSAQPFAMYRSFTSSMSIAPDPQAEQARENCSAAAAWS